MRIYGKNPVLERLKSNPKSIKKIYLEQDHVESTYVRSKARQWGIPVFSISGSRMVKMARDLNTQGMLIEIDDFIYVDFEEILEMAVQKMHTLLFLDHLNDPQNLGAIIRSAACFGHFAIVLPSRESVGVSEAVLRVASGADNFVQIAQVSNLNQAIVKAKDHGVWVAGALVGEGQNLSETKFNFPLGLVVGSEQKGIREIIKKQLDIKITIPMAYPRLSLNVAQAATIFCYEITRQKKNQRRMEP